MYDRNKDHPNTQKFSKVLTFLTNLFSCQIVENNLIVKMLKIYKTCETCKTCKICKTCKTCKTLDYRTLCCDCCEYLLALELFCTLVTTLCLPAIRMLTCK